MGNECCQDTHQSFPGVLTSKIPQKNQYQECDWPTQDQYIRQYIHKSENQGQKKPYRHKQNNLYYYGDWVLDTPMGHGILYQPNELLYQGSFTKSGPEGKGKIQFISKQCVYQGEISDGNANGKGTYENKKYNYKFQGDWQNSVPKHGTILLRDTGTQIQIQDYSKRKAKITYPDNKIYQGDIDNRTFLPHGKGKVTFKNHSHYEGDWEGGKMHGKGIFQWKIHNQNQEDKIQRYEGQYKNGKKHGLGKFNFSTGNYYQGSWQNGKMNGHGILYNNHGEIMKKGIWKEDKFDKKVQENVEQQKKNDNHNHNQ